MVYKHVYIYARVCVCVCDLFLFVRDGVDGLVVGVGQHGLYMCVYIYIYIIGLTRTPVRQADVCAALALARCFKVGYRSVPTVQSGYYNTLKGYPDGMNPVSTSGGMSPAPNPRVAVPPR